MRAAKKAKKAFFSAAFLLLAVVSPQAQNAGNESSGTKYKIASVNFDPAGITRQSALKRNVHIKEGQVFESLADLEAYIVDIKQKLINARLFETAQVEYTLGEADGGEIAVAVNVTTIDSRHFLFVPYPKYDSNDGFEAKIKFQDANFLGTMSELSADAFFKFEQTEHHENDYVLGGSLKYDFPFTLGKVEASWNNDFSVEYAFVRNEAEWNLKTGFTFILPFENFALRLDLSQGSTRELDYTKYGDDLYFTEYAKFSVPIKLETIKGFGDIMYTPSVSVTYNWDKDGIDSKNEDLVSPELRFAHSLSTGRVNWHGNFRRGISVSVTQSAAYNFQINQFQPGIEARLQGFYGWKYGGINTRLLAFAEFNSYRRYGHFLRGIGDDQYFAAATPYPDVYATKSAAGIILNLDFPIHLFTTNWQKIGWNWLRSFNFEMQIMPFIDIGLVQNRATERALDPRDGFYTAGIEVLVFPEKWKSVQVRGSIGFDIGRFLMKDIIDTSWRDDNTSRIEVSIGIGLFY